MWFRRKFEWVRFHLDTLPANTGSPAAWAAGRATSPTTTAPTFAITNSGNAQYYQRDPKKKAHGGFLRFGHMLWQTQNSVWQFFDDTLLSYVSIVEGEHRTKSLSNWKLVISFFNWTLWVYFPLHLSYPSSFRLTGIQVRLEIVVKINILTK